MTGNWNCTSKGAAHQGTAHWGHTGKPFSYPIKRLTTKQVPGSVSALGNLQVSKEQHPIMHNLRDHHRRHGHPNPSIDSGSAPNDSQLFRSRQEPAQKANMGFRNTEVTHQTTRGSADLVLGYVLVLSPAHQLYFELETAVGRNRAVSCRQVHPLGRTLKRSALSKCVCVKRAQQAVFLWEENLQPLGPCAPHMGLCLNGWHSPRPKHTLPHNHTQPGALHKTPPGARNRKPEIATAHLLNLMFRPQPRRRKVLLQTRNAQNLQGAFNIALNSGTPRYRRRFSVQDGFSGVWQPAVQSNTSYNSYFLLPILPFKLGLAWWLASGRVIACKTPVRDFFLQAILWGLDQATAYRYQGGGGRNGSLGSSA